MHSYDVSESTRMQDILQTNVTMKNNAKIQKSIYHVAKFEIEAAKRTFGSERK